MLAAGKNAVICDLAETYHIYDYRALPARTLAVLCAGLRDDSRIKLQLAGAKYDIKTYLLASAVDHLAMLAWFQTKDAQRGLNRPSSVLQAITRKPRNEPSYDGAEAFEAARRKYLKEGGGEDGD